MSDAAPEQLQQEPPPRACSWLVAGPVGTAAAMLAGAR